MSFGRWRFSICLFSPLRDILFNITPRLRNFVKKYTKKKNYWRLMRLKTIFFCGELAEKQKFMREQIFLGYKEAEKKNFLKAAIFLGQIF